MRSRGWSFTINNDTFNDLDNLLELTFDYLIIGFEVGEKGTSHIQGYIFYENAISFKSIKKKIPRAHIEKSKGTPQDNYDYCSKDGDYYEFGELPTKGKRTDIDSLVSLIEEGATREVIRQTYPKYYFMYKKKIEEMVKPTIDKDKQRKLYLIPEEKQYDYPGAFVDEDIDTYDGEKILVLSAYRVSFNVIAWIKGFPPRIKRGYEIIKIDPDEVYLTYTDTKQYNFLIKKYVDIIDGIQK